MIQIIKDIIPAGSKNRPGKPNPMQFITIHNTGNTNKGADAKSHAVYIKSAAAQTAQVSWHYTVDDKEAYQHLPDNENAWHAGDAGGDGNNKSIGIEICQNSDGDIKKATDNAAQLTAMLCKNYNIPVANVKQHYNWSGKNCPQLLRAGNPYNWETFIKKVSEYLAPPVTIPGKPSDWAREAWSWAFANKITDGTNPQGMPTREQVVQLLYNFAKHIGKA